MAALLDHTGKPFDSFALPHVMTYQAIMGSAYKSYYHDRWDEAYRHSREDALVMRRDGFLMSLLQERKLAVSSLNWHLEVPDENDQEQKRVRDNLTKAVKEIRGTRRIFSSLLEAIWFGRYGNQYQWRWCQVEGDRVLTAAKFLPVNGDKIGHTYDHIPYILTHAGEAAKLKDAEIIQTTKGRALKLTGSWRERFVIHYHEIDDRDFMSADEGEAVHGVGVRDRLFWLDWMRREWLANLSDYFERVGQGITLWLYPAGNPQAKTEAESAARDSSNRVNLVVPFYPDDKSTGKTLPIQRIETPTAGSEFLLRMVEHVEGQMERYVVGQTLSSKSEGSGLGGSGVADLHADTKLKIAAQDAALLGETLTGDDDEPGLVSIMKRWSYPWADFPVNLVFDVEKAESKEKLEAGKTVVEMGIACKSDELRAAAGLSKPGPDDEQVGGQPAGGQVFDPSGAGLFADKGAPVPMPAEPARFRRRGNPARYSTEDAQGHLHDGGTGQFTSKGAGDTQGETDEDETAEPAVDGKKPKRGTGIQGRDGKAVSKADLNEAIEGDPDAIKSILRRLDPENRTKFWAAVQAHHEAEAEITDEEWQEAITDEFDFDLETGDATDEEVAEINETLASNGNPFRIVRNIPATPQHRDSWDEEHPEPEEPKKLTREPELMSPDERFSSRSSWASMPTSEIMGIQRELGLPVGFRNVEEPRKQAILDICQEEHKNRMASWNAQQEHGFEKLHSAWEQAHDAWDDAGIDVERAYDEWEAKHGGEDAFKLEHIDKIKKKAERDTKKQFHRRGKVRRYAFDESKHPRADNGEFGAGGKGGAQPPSFSRAVIRKAAGVVANRYKALEARYGRKGAILFLSALVLTFPAPGSIAACVAVAETLRKLKGA